MQPILGIFLARDPWSGDVLQPRSMNGWTYVEGNPVNRLDPTGKMSIAAAFAQLGLSKPDTGTSKASLMREQIPLEVWALAHYLCDVLIATAAQTRNYVVYSEGVARVVPWLNTGWKGRERVFDLDRKQAVSFDVLGQDVELGVGLYYEGYVGFAVGQGTEGKGLAEDYRGAFLNICGGISAGLFPGVPMLDNVGATACLLKQELPSGPSWQGANIGFWGGVVIGLPDPGVEVVPSASRLVYTPYTEVQDYDSQAAFESAILTGDGSPFSTVPVVRDVINYGDLISRRLAVFISEWFDASK